MFKPNVELLPPKRMTAWRKICVGSWRPIGDSQVYGELDFDAEPALKFIEKYNKQGGEKITITHFTGRVLGKALGENRDLNAMVRWGKIYPRKNVDIFFQVVQNDKDLSGHVVRSIDKKSLTEVAQDLNSVAKVIKTGEDKNFKKIKDSWKMIPAYFSKHILKVIGFLFYSMNWHVPGLGVPKDAFGSAMITNIGSLGLERAFVPIPPYTNISLIIALGKTVDRVGAKNGQAVVTKRVSLCCTFDHRLMDGVHGVRMVEMLEYYFANPDKLD